VIRPVFFYWSGPDFDFGHYLAIASAALHAEDEVVVFVDEPADNVHFSRLTSLPRVRIEPLVLADLMSDAHADLYRRATFVAHRSDIVRFCVLHRYGGVYLDTDTVTRVPIAQLPELLLLEDGQIVHMGVMALPAGHPQYPGPAPLRTLQPGIHRPDGFPVGRRPSLPVL
jgi:hypothetical protein